MNPTPVRIGVMSFAHVHAPAYTMALRARPDVELLAADPDAEGGPPDELATRGAALAGRLGVRLVSDYDELLAWRPHGVVVFSENTRHRALVEQAAAAGVHVLCEKPLAATTTDAAAMVASCAAAGVNLMTAYPVRFHPAFQRMREHVKAGRLGRLHSAVGANNGGAPFRGRRWFLDPCFGGGAVLDHVVHLADLIGNLVDATPIEVYAQANHVMYAMDGGAETAGLVFVSYDDGFVATIDCSWSEPVSYPSWRGLTLTVYGSEATMTFDCSRQHVTAYDDRSGRADWVECAPGIDEALMVDEFVRSIREARPPRPDGVVGLRTLAVVEAAQASLATGLPAPVPHR